MDHNNLVPHNGVRRLSIYTPNILLHSIGKLLSHVDELAFVYPASLSMIDLSLKLSPLINICHLSIYDVIPGLELLLDGIILPRLKILEGFILSLFIVFASRKNQMKTLDTVDHLVIKDLSKDDAQCFSLKHWYIILDALPRLKTLLIELDNPICPPMRLAEYFIDYIKRKIRSPLTLFSCCMDDSNDYDTKEHFITYLLERTKSECSSIQVISIGRTRLDFWM